MENGQKKMCHGGFGYIKNRKRKYINKTLLFIGLGIFIFLIGYFLNEQSNRNVFTILAILMVLPGAKALVGYIVFHPFKSVSKERYQSVYEMVKANLPESKAIEETMIDTIMKEDVMNLYTDVVFTSPEKVMNLDFLVVSNSRMIGLVGSKKQKIEVLQDYMQKCMTGRKLPFGVKLYEDEKNFLSAVKSFGKGISDSSESLTKEEESKRKKNREEVIELLNCLIVD